MPKLPDIETRHEVSLHRHIINSTTFCTGLRAAECPDAQPVDSEIALLNEVQGGTIAPGADAAEEGFTPQLPTSESDGDGEEDAAVTRAKAFAEPEGEHGPTT